jgi:hypothetical protein
MNVCDLMDRLSDSSDSKSPEMTEAYSFTSNEYDVFNKPQLSGDNIPQALDIRLRELYSENITAKILRAADTCLENNVR